MTLDRALANGTRTRNEVDGQICGTGYRVDIDDAWWTNSASTSRVA